MRTRMILAALAGLSLATPAQAQKTQDEPRLVFTMGLTYTGGSDLWTVEDQPILVSPGTGFDLLDLSRRISGSGGVLFSGTYYPKAALGFTGEVFFMGIGLKDQCEVVPVPVDPETTTVCSSIDGSSKSSSAVLVSVGSILRAGGNQAISPYLRGQVGILISNLSPIRMQGSVTTPDGVFQVVIYDDPSSTRITPGFVLGGGFTTPLGKGWQLRTEVRDNLVQIATVDGPTSPGNDTPVIVNRWKNLFSIVVGADVVLEKKRGHRY
jgi:hypothetical protein